MVEQETTLVVINECGLRPRRQLEVRIGAQIVDRRGIEMVEGGMVLRGGGSLHRLGLLAVDGILSLLLEDMIGMTISRGKGNYQTSFHGSLGSFRLQPRLMVNTSLREPYLCHSSSDAVIGPVFRTDDLMNLFRNAVIPSSSARPKSPPPPPRSGKSSSLSFCSFSDALSYRGPSTTRLWTVSRA